MYILDFIVSRVIDMGYGQNLPADVVEPVDPDAVKRVGADGNGESRPS